MSQKSITTLRSKLGVSLMEVANESGLHLATVHEAEVGKVSGKSVTRILAALGRLAEKRSKVAQQVRAAISQGDETSAA